MVCFLQAIGRRRRRGHSRHGCRRSRRVLFRGGVMRCAGARSSTGSTPRKPTAHGTIPTASKRKTDGTAQNRPHTVRKTDKTRWRNTDGVHRRHTEGCTVDMPQDRRIQHKRPTTWHSVDAIQQKTDERSTSSTASARQAERVISAWRKNRRDGTPPATSPIPTKSTPTATMIPTAKAQNRRNTERTEQYRA